MMLQRLYWLLLLAVVVTADIVSGEEPACDVQASLELAAVHLSVGQPEAALRVLSCVIEVEPENPWLWYYTGAAHLQKGNAYDALTNLKQAQQLLQKSVILDDDLSERIQNLHRRARRSVLQFSKREGLAYDTNVSFLGDTALRSDIIAGEADMLYESRLAVSFAPIKTSEQTLTFGTESRTTWHFRIDEFDISSYAGFVRYEQHVGNDSQVSAQFAWDIVDLDNRSYLTRNALSLAWRHEWPSMDQAANLIDTVVSYSIEDQDFHYRVDKNFRQDGLVQSIGVVQRFSIRPLRSVPWQCTGTLGYTISDYDTDGREYDRLNHRALLALEMPLLNPWQLDEYLIISNKPNWLQFDYEWEYDRYSRSNATNRSSHKRRDRTITYGVTLSQVLQQERDRDLIVHVIARWMDADSNVRSTNGAAPFTFDKFVFGVQFQWSW